MLYRPREKRKSEVYNPEQVKKVSLLCEKYLRFFGYEGAFGLEKSLGEDFRSDGTRKSGGKAVALGDLAVNAPQLS